MIFFLFGVMDFLLLCFGCFVNSIVEICLWDWGWLWWYCEDGDCDVDVSGVSWFLKFCVIVWFDVRLVFGVLLMILLIDFSCMVFDEILVMVFFEICVLFFDGFCGGCDDVDVVVLEVLCFCGICVVVSVFFVKGVLLIFILLGSFFWLFGILEVLGVVLVMIVGVGEVFFVVSFDGVGSFVGLFDVVWGVVVCVESFDFCRSCFFVELIIILVVLLVLCKFWDVEGVCLLVCLGIDFFWVGFSFGGVFLFGFVLVEVEWICGVVIFVVVELGEEIVLLFFIVFVRLILGVVCLFVVGLGIIFLLILVGFGLICDGVVDGDFFVFGGKLICVGCFVFVLVVMWFGVIEVEGCVLWFGGIGVVMVFGLLFMGLVEEDFELIGVDKGEEIDDMGVRCLVGVVGFCFVLGMMVEGGLMGWDGVGILIFVVIVFGVGWVLVGGKRILWRDWIKNLMFGLDCFGRVVLLNSLFLRIIVSIGGW